MKKIIIFLIPFFTFSQTVIQLNINGDKEVWAYTTGVSGSGLQYPGTTPIKLTTHSAYHIVLQDESQNGEPIYTGLSTIEDVHAYMLSLPDVNGEGHGGIFYTTSDGHVWDYWNRDFLAWAVFNDDDVAHVLNLVTENSNTGIRLTSSDASLYGDIGNNALDLSYSNNNTSSGATGDSSVALGENTTASGETATATGQFTSASGKFSLSSGLYSNASGTTSVALGNNTIADGYGTLATGYFNTANANPQADSFDQSNTAFVIGNGTFENRSNAFKVLFDGTTTVAGSVTASSFIGDGSGLTGLPLVVESITEGGNIGVRLSSANAANHGDIGNNAVDLSYQSFESSTTGATGSYSTAMGYNTTASGNYSFASGQLSTASGTFSTAMGSFTTASGGRTTAMGYNTTASADYSTSMGYYTTASGFNSVAMGYRSIASGWNSFAIGYGTTSEGNASTGSPYYKNEALEERSFVIGGRNKATGVKSFTLGNDNLAQGLGSSSIGENNISTGDYSMALGLFSESVAKKSFAFGNNAYADGYNTTAIGSANTVDDSAIADQWNKNNRAFVIGNGFYDDDSAQLTRSDAFTVWFNGDATLAGNLNINSDARLKANILSLGSTLSKLLQIDGKSYTMKKDESEKQKIGLLAQDIEKVFPELVSESNGVKSVNYQGLVPVLINALKEQQTEIDRLKTQEERLERLERLVGAMD